MTEITRRDLLRRTAGVAALAATGFGTAACGGNSGRPSGGGGGDKTALAQWYHQYGEAGTKEAALRYAKEYPDASVTVQWTPGDYAAKLSSGLLSNKAPDVFESQLNIAMVKANQVAPLDDIMADVKDDFNPSDISTNTVDGKIYGIRMIDDPQLIYYRKSLLDAKGIKPPETIDDLIAAAKELTTDKVKGIFMGNAAPGTGAPALWSSGGQLLTPDNKAGFADPRALEAYAKLRQFFADKSVLLGAPTDWTDPGAFTQGLVAMQWCGLWAMPAIQKAFGDDFGVMAYPKLDDQGKPVLYSGGWTQFVSAKSANLEAAKKYVKWLWIDKADLQEDWCLNYGFHIPPRKSLAAKASKLQSGPAAEAVKLNEQYGVTDNPAWIPKMNTAFGDMMVAITRKGTDPAAAAGAAEKTVNAELSRLFG